MRESRPSNRASVIPWRPAVVLLVGAALALIGAHPARAQIGSERYSSIVMEAATGNTLMAVSADEPRFPASLTKMMTLYMVFEALRDQRLTLDQSVPVSMHAATMSPSKLGLMPATRITVEQAILGLVTKSANDAAAALGELLGGGDEQRFGQMMTLRARALGMSHTVFRNASGLPNPEQVTTARDLAVLARHLVQDFPSDYRYFSTPAFVFHGRTIPNHDHLLQTYPGADGIKTGYIEASGFNLVTSAVRGDVRLIGVVIGAARPGERDLHMAALLDRGFEAMGVPISSRRDMVAARLPLVAAAQAASVEMPVRTALHARVLAARWTAALAAMPSEATARAAATLARRAADAGDIRIDAVVSHGRTQYRGNVTGLTPADARSACAAAIRHRIACTALRPENGQVASR